MYSCKCDIYAGRLVINLLLRNPNYHQKIQYEEVTYFVFFNHCNKTYRAVLMPKNLISLGPHELIILICMPYA